MNTNVLYSQYTDTETAFLQLYKYKKTKMWEALQQKLEWLEYFWQLLHFDTKTQIWAEEGTDRGLRKSLNQT